MPPSAAASRYVFQLYCRRDRYLSSSPAQNVGKGKSDQVEMPMMFKGCEYSLGHWIKKRTPVLLGDQVNRPIPGSDVVRC